MINKFTDLLKQLKEPKSSILYQSYVDILNQYDFNERDVVHQQWTLLGLKQAQQSP